MSRTPVSPEALALALPSLRDLFRDRYVDNATVREQHGNTLSEVPNQPPDAVVLPLTTGEVASAIKICAAHGVPVIPFGTGTSFEGHVNAPFGGVSIDTRLMKNIVAIDCDDLDCRVEAGVTRDELNAHLRDTGLFFPIDPGASASLGGMAATRASGTNAVRYGTMKDVVLSVTAVLPNGEIVLTGGRARKSSAGYDLTRLMVGSEGTLGLITELGLRLSPIPEEIASGVCPFPTIKSACDAVIATIQSGVPMARIELLDDLQIRACNAHSRLSLAETPTLFVEFHGTRISVAEQTERFAEIAAQFEGGQTVFATRPEDRTKLWKARSDAYWAARALRPDAKGISTDVCVPISRLSDCVDESKADSRECGLLAPIVGHVGDGNFHIMPLIDFRDPLEVAKGAAFLDRLVRRALRFGGTCTGEHGVGQSNMRYLTWEFNEATLNMMRTIKRALDPQDIMNPGKLFTVEAHQ